MAENTGEKAPKKKQNRNGRILVVKETTTAIQVGRDNYLMKTTSDGRGVRMENGEGSIFVPFGEAGRTIVENLKAQVEAGSGRKRRRTKAEIQAQSAQA